MPPVPDTTLDLLVNDSRFGLTMTDAKALLLLDDGDRVEYYMEIVALLRNELDGDTDILSKAGKTAGNWVLHELGGLLVTSDTEWAANPVSPSQMAIILSRLLKREITGKVAKHLLGTIFYDPSREVEQVIEEENLLLRPMSTVEYTELLRIVLEGNAETARAVQETGHQGKLMFLVGQMVRNGEEGRVEADKAKAFLRKELGLEG